MNLENFLTLKIRVTDFNIVAQQPELLAQLRKLTLSPYSGMNYELNHLIKDSKYRKVNCKILRAYRSQDLVSWGLLSKEDTDFTFMNSSYNGFKGSDGWLFQVYTDPKYRRQGIASELIKVARRKVNNEILHVCPWDDKSFKFYEKFPNFNTKCL